MRKKTKKRLIVVAGVVAAVLCIGTVLGFAGNLKLPGQERSEDNLITLDCIEEAGVELGESYKSKVSDVTVTIDDDGVIKLEGTATANDEIVYAKVTLPAGVYRFSGAPDSSRKTYQLQLTDGTTVYNADDEDVISITAEAEYTVKVLIYEDCDFGIFGEKLYPVIWEVEDSDDDTVVKFWE